MRPFVCAALCTEHKLGNRNIEHVLSNFLVLFRTFMPNLCSYFEDEELTPNEWALIWFRVRWTHLSYSFELQDM